MEKATLSALTVYPVKSCSGISLQRVQIDRFGLSGDRRWLMVDSDDKFITQREQAHLALLKTAWEEPTLSLHWGDASLFVEVPDNSATLRTVSVWQDTVIARDAGDEAAAWLQRHLGLLCRLVHMPDDWQRRVDTTYARGDETVSFADGFPLLLICEASLDDLNSRLTQPVPMDRFRPNIVVSGCAPFAEDNWRQIRIGNSLFDIAKPCSRCVIPSINQQSAKRDPQINRVLASFRRRGRAIYFGQNLLYGELGELTIGDSVEIISHG
jgi:uncharacterized protein YcbX